MFLSPSELLFTFLYVLFSIWISQIIIFKHSDMIYIWVVCILIKTRYLSASMGPDSDSRSAASEPEPMRAKNRVRDGAAPEDTQPRARGKKFTLAYPDTTAGSFVWRQESSWQMWRSHATMKQERPAVKTDTISVVVAERNYAPCLFCDRQ